MKVVAGLGFRQQTSCQALHQVLEQALSAAAQGQRQPMALQALATAADKCSHPTFSQLAAKLALPVHAVPPVQAQSAPPSGVEMQIDSLSVGLAPRPWAACTEVK